MRRFQRFFALLVCLALLLTACGAESRTSVEETSPSGSQSQPEPATEETAAETPQPEVTEEPQPYTEPPEPLPAVRVQLERKDGDNSERVVITGLTEAGDAAWTREFSTEYRTELTLIEEIGAWKDRCYFNNNGTVVCLRIADGETLWENSEFCGASISGLVDERNGNIYLCGWYGPDFFACDCDGNTLNRSETVVDGFCWPSGMIWYGENELMLYYHGGFSEPDGALPFVVDLTDYSFSWQFSHQELNATEQYWANVFVSDFAEQHMTGFPLDNGSDYELASFAHMFCKINRHEAISYEGDYETVSLDTVNELCLRFFGRDLDPEEGVHIIEGWGRFEYKDGKFYFPAADGESYNRFAVVREYLELPSSVLLTFDVYELNLDEYWDHGMDDALYHMTAAEAESAAVTHRINLVGSGTAEVLPIWQDGHDGYHLYWLNIDLF